MVMQSGQFLATSSFEGKHFLDLSNMRLVLDAWSIVAFLQTSNSFIVAFGSLRQALYHILSGSVLQCLSGISQLISVGQLGFAIDSAVELLPEDPPVQDVPIESWYFDPW